MGSTSAVMGSKLVKAVVLKGNRSIELADPEGMKAPRRKHLPAFKEGFGADLRKYGTPMFLEGALRDGDIPWKNCSSWVKEMPDCRVTADGKSWGLGELERLGLRITLARQIFNVRAGWTLQRFTFPDRALGSGELKGVSVDLQALVREYLEDTGWDEKTGLPSEDVLRELNLSRFLTGA